MMPRDKAIDIIDSFFNAFPKTTHVKTIESVSKECALIFCDNMLDNAGFIWGGRDDETSKTARDKFREYWIEVKQWVAKS